MPRNKIFNIWYFSQNSEWVYTLDDNTFAGGSSIPLPLTYIDTPSASEFDILCDNIFADFVDVAIITVNPFGAPNNAFVYLKNSGTPLNLGDCAFVYDLLSLSQFSGIVAPALPPLPSLNGDGCEYKDGAEVTLLGRSAVYSVSRSFMGIVSDSNYTVLYDLVSSTGLKVTSPEVLLTPYVAPVVTIP